MSITRSIRFSRIVNLALAACLGLSACTQDPPPSEPAREAAPSVVASDAQQSTANDSEIIPPQSPPEEPADSEEGTTEPLSEVAANAPSNVAAGESIEPWLTVSSDPAEIDRARQASAQGEDEQWERFENSLEYTSYFDAAAMLQIERDRDRAISHSVGMLPKSGTTDQSVGAAMLLCRMQQEAGRSFAGRILKEGSAEQRRRLLSVLGGGQLRQEEAKSYREFLLADRQLAPLVLAQLDDHDEKIVSAAIDCCGSLDLPGAGERFLKMLRRHNVPDEGGLLFWLSTKEPTDELFRLAVESRVNSEDPRHGLVFAEFIRTAPEPLRSQARDQLRAILTRWRDAGKLGFEASKLSLLSALAKGGTSEDLDWLRKTAESEDYHYAVGALAAYVQLSPEEGRKLLLKWLPTEEHRSAAIRAIADNFVGSRDEEFVQALGQIAPGVKGATLLEISDALVTLGGTSARDEFDKMQNRLSPESRAHFLRRFEPPSREEMSEALHEPGLLALSAQEKENLQRELARDEAVARGDLPPQLFELIRAANRGLAFDAEVVILPCRHDELVHRFAKVSGGKFAPEAVLQVWHQKDDEDDKSPYTLQFVVGGRLYQAAIRNFGGWYDVERVVLMINSALAQQGIPERFLGMEFSGHTTNFVFADPERLTPIANRFGMSLSDDFDAARRNGLKFEAEMRNRLQK